MTRSIVVLEKNTQLPYWVDGSEPTSDIVIFAQAPQESCRELEARLYLALALQPLETVTRALLVCNMDDGRESTAVRMTILRGLVDQLQHYPRGQLVICLEGAPWLYPELSRAVKDLRRHSPGSVAWTLIFARGQEPSKRLVA